MKTLFLILVVTILFASCNKEKCITCTEANTGVKGSFCGDRKDRKNFEKNLKVTGESLGQTWTCKESD